MSVLRIEYVPVQRFYLGLIGFSHLQITYQQDTEFLSAQDYWYVLEGVQDGPIFGGTLGVFGTNGRSTLSLANDLLRDQDLIDAIGTPEDRGAVTLALSVTATSFWQTMVAFATDLNGQELPYVATSSPFHSLPTINSSSVAASLLWQVGINIHTVMPYGVGFSPGRHTLLGGSGADKMQGSEDFLTIIGGAGNDEIRGHDNFLYMEKLYGGLDDDTFYWSPGYNTYHGGEPYLIYRQDGFDTVDYSGIGEVNIEVNQYRVEGKTADFRSVFSGGQDLLFSIEQVVWNVGKDVVNAGEGVYLLENPIYLDTQGSASGLDDVLNLAGGSAPLLINAINEETISVQTLDNVGLDAGYWVHGAEQLTGSGGDDRIYVGPTVLVVDGGAGDDLIDARLATAFSGLSPQGYDIEIFGGVGADTIISGAGRTVAYGGEGADIFVLSTMATNGEDIEFVIEDADGSDRLFVPYDFFQETRGTFDGSRLLQVSGGAFQLADNNPYSFFEWGNPGPSFDYSEFVGSFDFTMDGADLIVSAIQGSWVEFREDYGPYDPPGDPYIAFVGEGETITTIRVRNWSNGDLGISFPLVWDSYLLLTLDNYYDYPGLRAVLDNALTPDRFLDPLDLRPDPYVPLEIAQIINSTTPAAASPFAVAAAAPPVTIGGDGNDVLFADDRGPYTFEGHGGNDDITGSIGGDLIDGGTGDDVMRGGRGNDIYLVDSIGDQVIEDIGGGFDRIISSIDITLGANVEHLRLTGDAISGTGNSLRNTLEGNYRDNILEAGVGDDTLAGNRGDDTLIGGQGGDGYVYELGDGHDIIIETATNSLLPDVVVLANGINPDDVVFQRSLDNPFDLILRFIDGGTITLRDQLRGDGSGIEAISFANSIDDRVWTAADIQAFADAATFDSNTRPVANNDLYFAHLQDEQIIPLAALTENDSDADGHHLTLLSVANVVGATAEIMSNGDVRLTNFSADTTPVTFDYTIEDGHGGTATATLELARRLTPLTDNTDPVAHHDRGYSVAAGHTLTFTSAELLANDSDADGDPLSISSVYAGYGSAVSLDDISGDITFTAPAIFRGDTFFFYTVDDGHGGSASGRVFVSTSFTPPTIPVAINTNPEVTAVTLDLASENTPTYGSIRATDAESQPLTYSLRPDHMPTLGDVVFAANGDFLYTPHPDTSGLEGFTAIISDSAGGVTEHVFSFLVAPANGAASDIIVAPATSNGPLALWHDIEGSVSTANISPPHPYSQLTPPVDMFDPFGAALSQLNGSVADIT